MMVAEVERFLRACHARLADVPDGPGVAGGRAALGDALDRCRPRDGEPSWLPVLDTIDRLPKTDLAGRFVEAAPAMRWVASPRSNDGGTTYALAPLNELFDFGSTMVGVMYVGPGERYPLHYHPPQELYLVVSGRARWRYGGSEAIRPVEPGQTLYNRPDDLHTVVAGVDPLAALYVLWP